MRGKSKLKEKKADFIVQIPEYSDAEILNILKKRNQYQPDAAKLAIFEALKRRLINSEDDLLVNEFRTKPLKKTLFPLIENKQQKKKISRSITRGLLITGIIPVIFGILKINEGARIEGGFITVGGVLWIIFASQNIRKINLKLLRLSLGLLFIAAIYLVYLFFQFKSLIYMDVFIVAVLYSIATYGLIYLIKLHPEKKDEAIK